MSKDRIHADESVLMRIEGPEDVRGLSIGELETLSEEIRDLIIETVSKTGGHLASSLGVVELTLALLKVFAPPEDRIVFDVGHQAYTYKILTGRRDVFHTLRAKGGISGFPKRSESPCDCFDVGHAGNAISAAAGMAQARCMNRRSHKVIAVVGDGSLTCGVSYEGLNQAGAAKKDLIIILNDNEMSISPNVGAMAAYLNRIMTGQVVTRFRREVKAFLMSFPGNVGKSMYGLAKQFEEAFKGFITPGGLFEDLGFKYVGPIDGHRIKHLVDTLTNVKRFQEPVLVHCVTRKGKGYKPAEEHPSRFHGLGPFDRDTGVAVKSKGAPSFTEVFGKAVLELADEDPRVVAVTAAMEHGTGLHEFAVRHPQRFFDVGIAEQHGVVFAAGLAREGLRPVTAIYSSFLQRGFDHIVHDVCMQGFPVLFAVDRAGIVGEDGPTHHGVFDIPYLRQIPNLTFMAPSDKNEMLGMLRIALSLNGPSAIRYPRGECPGETLQRRSEPLPVGKGRIVIEGRDLLILALGPMLRLAVRAAALLADEGIKACVADPRFIKPLDRDLILRKALETGYVLTVEEGVLAGGFGSATLELLADEGVKGVQVTRMGVPDMFVEHGPRDELLEDLGLTVEGIAEQARRLIEGRAPSKLRRIV
jgi:1-deoxy-D-xylulose-5-phosphate synthase